MSVKTTDILARLRAGIATLRPTQGLLDAGFECGAVSNEDLNWLFWMLYQSALGNVHKWNSECADNGGYTHPAVVLGSDGLFYITIVTGDYTNDPTTSVGVDWDLFDTTALPTNYRTGYILTRDSNTVFGVGAGAARSYDDALDLQLVAGITKSISAAWAEGTGNGCVPTAISPVVANTWYRVFAIGKPDGTVDAGLDTSATAATLMADAVGSGYTKYRRIGWVRTNGSAQLTDFYHDPDDYSSFILRVPVVDVSLTTLPTGSRTLAALSVPPNSVANISLYAETGVTRYVWVSSPEMTDAAVTTSNSNIAVNGGSAEDNINDLSLKTDSNSRVGYRADTTGGFTLFRITTRGWKDNGITP